MKDTVKKAKNAGKEIQEEEIIKKEESACRRGCMSKIADAAGEFKFNFWL